MKKESILFLFNLSCELSTLELLRKSAIQTGADVAIWSIVEGICIQNFRRNLLIT